MPHDDTRVLYDISKFDLLRLDIPTGGCTTLGRHPGAGRGLSKPIKYAVLRPYRASTAGSYGDLDGCRPAPATVGPEKN